MRGKAHRSQMRKSLMVLSLVGGLTIGVMLLIQAEVVRADEPLPPAAAGYPIGKVTSIYERSFQIDGRTVSLVSEAVLVDRHGDPLKPADLRVDIDVKYHIQKGTTDRIDWMLLLLPE